MSYSDYPDHPLADVPDRVLEIARGCIQAAVEEGLVDPEMGEPIADAVIADLIEAGYVIKESE